MLTNPLHIAVFQGQGEAERKQIEQMFIKLFKELPGVIFIAKLDGRMVGVMRMKSCVGRKVTDDVDGIGHNNSKKGRTAQWHHAWAAHDPLEQHWHLGPIGVLPSCQGTGIGTRLMDRFCREVDACRAGAYLETDLQQNVRFYERFGFKVRCEGDVLNASYQKN
jgi:ribosomal protein S18 acetylase RimI-like enzyme